MDFSIKKYNQLISALQSQGYFFQTFENFLEKPEKKAIILRHDVDLKPEKSLKFAKVLLEKGIKGTFYFRTTPCSWDVEIMKSIAFLGHEVGYHYECLDFIANENKSLTKDDLLKLALKDFEKNLKKFHDVCEIKTISMHGRAFSKWDNRLLWKEFNYRDYDIIGEPYFDIDFSKVLYLTDSDRKWNSKTRIFDKEFNTDKKNKSFNSTNEIIKAAKEGRLPDKIMMTFHPQRWHDSVIPWMKELVMQSAKNQVKRVLLRMRD
jgi:hypothetical protein